MSRNILENTLETSGEDQKTPLEASGEDVTTTLEMSVLNKSLSVLAPSPICPNLSRTFIK